MAKLKEREWSSPCSYEGRFLYKKISYRGFFDVHCDWRCAKKMISKPEDWEVIRSKKIGSGRDYRIRRKNIGSVFVLSGTEHSTLGQVGTLSDIEPMMTGNVPNK